MYILQHMGDTLELLFCILFLSDVAQFNLRSEGRSDYNKVMIKYFTITAEIHARSLVKFYCQYADRPMNLKFMRRVSERGRAIRQFDIVKNKLMSVLNVSVLLLTMNFVIILSK